MAVKSLSGQELAEMPKKLREQEEKLKEKEVKLLAMEKEQEEKLLAMEKEQEEKLKEKEVKLLAMEKDVKEQCKALDKKEAEALASIKKWEKINGLTDSAESFSQLYESINKIYVIWTHAGGNDEKLFETIKKIIEARRSMAELNG